MEDIVDSLHVGVPQTQNMFYGSFPPDQDASCTDTLLIWCDAGGPLVHPDDPFIHNTLDSYPSSTLRQQYTLPAVHLASSGYCYPVLVQFRDSYNRTLVLSTRNASFNRQPVSVFT